MEDIVLYHGSRGGIEGNIAPISRARCDFGQGFYLGENVNQARGIVCDYEEPYIYKILLQLSQIKEENIVNLTDKKWLYTVLAFRKNCPEFNELEIAEKYKKWLSSKDVIIGPIADDRMKAAISAFKDKTLTDEGLIKCLQSVGYGKQYVLKNEFACSKAKILEEKELIGYELHQAKEYSYQKQYEAQDIVRKMIVEERNNGLYLDQLVKIEKNKERSRNDGMCI